MSKKGMVEVRWHSRAGQGGVTAAKVLAETSMALGKFVQAIPEYGAEREGAPVKAYTRISDSPIVVHTQVTDPDYVVVLDETLLDIEDVTEGLAPEGKVIVNTSKSPEEVRKRLGLEPGQVATVDATSISIECIGRPIPNTPMIGALARVTGLLSVEELAEDFRKKFSGKLSDRVIEGNVRAIQKAAEEVRTE
ncbi:MAG: pyruvate synthase [Candidatus Latescibacterota bacterium]|nr:MAG: pyruvate synthase [Candidatus Latescibacterota bacterium]RKY73336.1 MAG: pyruvate synthase [Candidatus Latescibacterota bacterium]HDI00577.1 pyruvate synthase [Bacillota bacterium]